MIYESINENMKNNILYMTQTDSSCLALAQLKPDVFFIVFYTLMAL